MAIKEIVYYKTLKKEMTIEEIVFNLTIEYTNSPTTPFTVELSNKKCGYYSIKSTMLVSMVPTILLEMKEHYTKVIKKTDMVSNNINTLNNFFDGI